MGDRYERLREFISRKMRMSHVYKPVMLLELLRHRGVASKTEVAKALLLRDASQVEGETYRLAGFDELSIAETANLEALCISKIEDYVGKRGERIWAQRRKSSDPVPGTLRYEILKRARFRCELCGVSAEEKALEVDHIVPRNAGGKNDELNLQALCYSCNATKRDRDSTDFRAVASSYAHRVSGCSRQPASWARTSFATPSETYNRSPNCTPW